MEKRTSIKSIANMAGVSPTTVQNVLHGRKNCMKEETYQKVLEVLRENDYVERAAPKLLNGKTEHVVGVAISESILESEDLEEAASKLFQLEKENYENQCYTIFHVSSKVEEISSFFQAWPVIKIYVFGFDEIEKNWLKEKTGVFIDTLV